MLLFVCLVGGGGSRSFSTKGRIKRRPQSVFSPIPLTEYYVVKQGTVFFTGYKIYLNVENQAKVQHGTRKGVINHPFWMRLFMQNARIV